MLAEKIFIFQPTSLGGGQYTADLFFQNTAKPQFLNLNDYIEDSEGHTYKIIAPTVIPFTEGATATVEFVSDDVMPTEDEDYDSFAYTPDQVDFEPAVRTSGSLSSPSLFNGPNFEWTVTSGWNDPAEANKAIVGDRVVDFLGKEYEITFIHVTNRFNDPIRIKEVERVGIAPTNGDATLYRPTDTFKFFQGTELTDPARTVIQNRDIKRIDLNLNSSEGGGSGKSIENSYLNSSGDLLPTLKPVRSSSGNLGEIDPGFEADVKAILGIVKEDIANGASGIVVLDGLIENITTSYAFDTVVYLSKTGNLTDTAPDVGVESFVAGDFVVRLGQITKNSANPSNKDFKVKIEIIGQL